MFCDLLLSLSASGPRVFSVYIMQIGKRSLIFFISMCVWRDGCCFVFHVVVLPGQKRSIWGTSCFYFIFISEVELLLTFFFILDHKCALDVETVPVLKCSILLLQHLNSF